MESPAGLDHVLWLGGPPGSGKTTIASRLAKKHGLRLYSADTRTWAHRDRAIAAGNEAAIRWEAMSIAERWSGTAEELLAFSLHGERGPMVLEDLAALPESRLVIAEGTVLPAWAIENRSRALWLSPTQEFQERMLAERDLPPGPAKLYRYLAVVTAKESRAQGIPTITVDGSEDVEAIAARVERHFARQYVNGPRATTNETRRPLLREANLAIVEQVRGYYARPWASGDPEAIEREFLCECGSFQCIEMPRRTVGEAAAAPVIVPGHD